MCHHNYGTSIFLWARILHCELTSRACCLALQVFRGDGDELVDALVEACSAKARSSLEAPCLPHLIGRELTPYFGSSEPVDVPVRDNK